MDPKDKETVREARDKEFKDAAERRYKPTFITDPDKPEHPFDLNYAARDAHLQGLRIGYALALLDKPPVPTVPEWVSVKDRLPEANIALADVGKVSELILVYRSDAAPGQNIVTTEYRVYNDGSRHFIGMSGYSVTHWRELPAPPHPVNEPL